MNVNQDLCRFCLSCAEKSACPGLKHVETEYGRKMDTDLTACITDGACERIKACSSFEHVTIKRKKPPRPPAGTGPGRAARAPGPPRPREHLAVLPDGVGGMGIGVATSIVVRAGTRRLRGHLLRTRRAWPSATRHVQQRHLQHRPPAVTANIPYGKADLLIGVDILEAAGR